MFQTNVLEKIKTHILYSVTCFFENHVLYGIVWENMVRARQATDDNIIQHISVVCWITKATDTHSEYVICIVLSQEQWLHEHT